MDLSAIASAAGGAILNTILPGSGTIAAKVINGFLSDDEKVNPETVTGTELKAKIEKLPPEAQTAIHLKMMDAQINETNKFVQLQTMLNETDAKGASHRPFIALMMAWLVVVITAVFAAGLLWLGYQTNQMPSWEQILPLLALPTWVVQRYFGKRSQEKQLRTQLAAYSVDPTHSPLPQLAQGVVSTVLSAIKK